MSLHGILGPCAAHCSFAAVNSSVHDKSCRHHANASKQSLYSHLHSLNIVCCECPKPHHGSSTQRQDLLCQRPWQRTSDKDSGVIFVIPFRCMCSVVPHMCVLVQILLPGALSGLTATLSTLVGELSRSDSEDTLEEQVAELLKLPRKLEDVCAQLCEKLQKVPLPALGQVAAPLGSLAPFAFQQASHKCCRRPHSLHCDSTLWKRCGGAFCPQGPTKARCHTIWLLVPLLGCCQFWPLRKGHRGVPAAKTQPARSCAWT